MTRNIKTFRDLEKDISKIFCGKEEGIYLIDTGALIDIQRMSEKEGSCSLSKPNLEIYLDRLSRYAQPLMTDLTYEEVKIHSSVIKNGHTREISPYAYYAARTYNRGYHDTMKRLEPSISERNRLFSWLIVRNHLIPLIEEEIDEKRRGISSIDEDIIKNAYVLCKTPFVKETKFFDVVCLLTSDKLHVANMGYLLKKFYCENLEIIDTRS